jgi:hypothetical protein
VAIGDEASRRYRCGWMMARMDWTTGRVWGRAQHKQGAVQAVGPGNRLDRGGRRIVKGREDWEEVCRQEVDGVVTEVVIKKNR